MNVDDYLNKDVVGKSIDDLAKDIENFDELGPVILIWEASNQTNVRLYGTPTEITGLLYRLLHDYREANKLEMNL